MVNRQKELKFGAEPKGKREALALYDERIMKAMRKYKNRTFTLHQYWAKIVELKSDYGYQKYE